MGRNDDQTITLILTSLQDISGEVGGLRADVRNIKESVSALSGDIKTCDVRIGSLEKKISSTSILPPPGARSDDPMVAKLGISWNKISSLIIGVLLGAAAVGALLAQTLLK